MQLIPINGGIEEMRIWYQSSTPLGKDPSLVDYEQALKGYIKQVARPDSAIDIHGVDIATPGADRCRYFKDLNIMQVINNAIKAEREGYDAFAVGCLADPGFPEIMQVVDIPTLFAAMTSFHLACLLSPNFSVIHFGKLALLNMEDRIRSYGLAERYIPGSYLELGQPLLHDGFKNPDSVMESVTKEAREIIKRGACLLIPGCIILNMILVKQGVKEIEGVPVLDAAGALIKTTELMVDLKKNGITRSKCGLYIPVLKEELEQVRKLHGVE